MEFEIPEGYSIISEDEYADMVNQPTEPVKFETAGVIRNGWLSEVSELAYIEPDAHLDDVEILVDCE